MEARITRLFCVAVMLLSSAVALGQAYPSRPIRMVVPFSPGTASDILARQLASGLTQELRQPVSVDNRPGGAAVIGAEAVAKSAPDGYTLLLASSQSHATNSSLLKKLPYDPIADFTPIARLTVFPAVLVVHESIPAKSVAEFVAYARKRPGQLNYASTGSGTQAHLQAAMLSATAGLSLTHVPFKEAGQAFSALIRGDIQVMFYPHSALGAVLQSGKARVLASTGEKRSPRTPDVPTMSEAGYPEVTLAAWNAFYAPAGTSPQIVDILNRATQRVLEDPATRTKFGELGIEIAYSGPEELAAFTRAEIERYRRLVAVTGLKVE